MATYFTLALALLMATAMADFKSCVDEFDPKNCCDNLPYSNQTTHIPGGENSTKTWAYSWHIHSAHIFPNQTSDRNAFISEFATEFGKYSENGTKIGPCAFGFNAIAPDSTYICGETSPQQPGKCGLGLCTSEIEGPWTVCQSEIFVPSKYIDEVSAWIRKPEHHRSLAVMRHPNTGCQWGDHGVRAEWYSTLPAGPRAGQAPEICQDKLPCNKPGYGCLQGGCETNDGKPHPQNCDCCAAEAELGAVRNSTE